MYGVGGGNRKRPQSFVGLVEAGRGGVWISLGE